MIEKDEYIQKLHTKFDELNEEIDKLKVKAEAVKTEKMAKYQRHIEDLQEKRKTIEKMVEKIRAVGNDGWEELKLDLDNTWDSLEEALKSARSSERVC